MGMTCFLQPKVLNFCLIYWAPERGYRLKMLDLDASLFVIFAIVWILLLVLKKVFFKPMESVRRERNKLLGQNRNAFDQAKEKHEKTLSEIEARIKEARAEVQTIRAKYEEEAQKERERLVLAVSEESRVQVEKAKSELESKMKELSAELREKTEIMAESIEQRLLH